MQSAHYYEYIFWLFSQHNGCAIYGKQVAYVEFANKLHPNFSAIYLKIHTSEWHSRILALKSAMLLVE